MEVNKNELPKNSEQWASIDCYKNYQVSWWGRVRNSKTGRILKNCLKSNGYLGVCASKNSQRKTLYIHQLVAREWIKNPDNKRCVDHIDGNPGNNHYENLRYATHAENSRNQKIQNNTSSIYKGVCFSKQSNKWVVHIHVNGKTQHVGCFDIEREAAAAYNVAAIEHYKEFARLNIFDD